MRLLFESMSLHPPCVTRTTDPPAGAVDADGAAESDDTDSRWMTAALTLARRGLGQTWPNPAVGCLLVCPAGHVVGRGWTQPGGRPHAERIALDQAGAAARGATAYVTLEPCSHHGQTPPCADALIAAGVARVVVALIDPDPRVAGRGLARLRAAGVAVSLGCAAVEAREVARGFLTHRLLGRPMVTLKTAATLDGRIATASGESRWITGRPARQRGHLLRATHDAIAVGLGTVRADDPALTCRLPGLEDRTPVRVVFDSQLALPPTARLLRDADRHPLWVVHAAEGPDRALAPTKAAGFVQQQRRLTDLGATLIPVAATVSGRPDIATALTALADRGITRLLVEGGGQLAAGFLAAGVVDVLAWFQAPRLLGGDGQPSIAAFGLDRLAESPMFTPRDTLCLGEDSLSLAIATPDPLDAPLARAAASTPSAAPPFACVPA